LVVTTPHVITEGNLASIGLNDLGD
jgi:hypothetical protein